MSQTHKVMLKRSVERVLLESLEVTPCLGVFSKPIFKYLLFFLSFLPSFFRPFAWYNAELTESYEAVASIFLQQGVLLCITRHA